MAWDTYIVIALVSAAVGFYLVKGLFPKCPQCQTRMKYSGAVDPKFDKASSEGKSPQFNDLRPGFFSVASRSERIQFHYVCPQCGKDLQK